MTPVPGAFTGFPEATFRFLRGLTKHNDKAWFEAHRGDYQAGYLEPALAFVAALGSRLRKISPGVQFEPRVNGSLFRINRDIRFSKDKTPYKNHIDIRCWHGDKNAWGTPAFFFRMFADSGLVGTGMHHLEKQPLDRYRRALLAPRPGAALVKAVAAVRAAGDYQLGGASRKRVPPGFPADHPRASFLLHDALWVEHHFEVGPEAGQPGFVELCARHFAAMWPVGQWLLREVAQPTQG